MQRILHGTGPDICREDTVILDCSDWGSQIPSFIPPFIGDLHWTISLFLAYNHAAISWWPATQLHNLFQQQGIVINLLTAFRNLRFSDPFTPSFFRQLQRLQSAWGKKMNDKQHRTLKILTGYNYTQGTKKFRESIFPLSRRIDISL